ncbi:MAG TPA: type IV pilus secretin PilQ [Novimethylophilus sp.]|jgi:type IV pilus assembly protein PilQ|uniref:type IV pilus secretin PilQ n=1 Tax=Novimethylophilus sp. TaxID=2137426 RepID=UPI002F40CFC9
MINYQYMKFRWLGALLAMGLLALNASAADNSGADVASDSNTVEKIDYSALPGGKVVVKVTLKQEPAQPPAAFTTAAPPRIALDFVNVGNHLPKNAINAGDGLLRSMNAVQANNRTRIVLNLNKPATYSTSIEGRTVLVTLQANGSAGVPDAATTHFSQAVTGLQKNALKNVDFQRGKNGEGRIIVDLEEAGTGIDIRQQGKNLVVEFLNTAIPAKMERRLNVTNFATPVLTVDTYRQGQNIRMVIEPKGDWEHSAYQTDRRFTVEVKPIVFDPNKIMQGSKTGFSGDKLSLDFNGIDVKSLLRIIGDFTGKNVVVSDAIQGTITLRLKDVPWDQALDIIMKQKGLGMDNLGNTLVFAPKDEIATRRKQDQEQENQIDDIKPLVTQSFEVKYQKAADIKTLISDAKQPLLSKRGSAVVDPVTNTLFVKDIDTSLAKIQEILNKVDISARQVLIEARIVNADESFSKSLGAKFGVTKKNGNNAFSSHVANSQNLATKTTTLGQVQDLNVNLPATSATGSALSSLAFTLFKLPAGFLLNLELSAAEADGKTKIISSPRVITANQQQSSFDFGEEIPYQQASSSGATSVAFKKATLGILVTPQITPDDKIGMDIEVTNDSRGKDTTAGPAINTNKVKTKVLVDNGETAVLGGFYKETKKDANERVPFFGALPIVGPLFRSNAREDSKQEILFFITPKIMSDSMQLN